MIDIKFLRENPEIVKQNIKNKFQDSKLPLVDEVIELDKQSRAAKKEADELRAQRNANSKKIGALMGQKKLEEAEEMKALVTSQAEKLQELEQRVKALGGRVLPLKVSGGFHSPFMNEAAEEFAVFLKEANIKKPEITAYSNVTAKPYEDDVVSVLEKQINHPVKWEDTIKRLAENGFDTFIETGVGTTLMKLVTKILPEARSFAVSDTESLAKLREELHI